MEDGHEFEALKANLEIREENQNFKFKWLGNLDALKIFVGSVLNLTGEWRNNSSNGGHHFKSSEVSISFYPSTKTLLIQGSMQPKYQEILSEIVFGQESNTGAPVNDHERSTSNLTDSEFHNSIHVIPESIIDDDEGDNPSWASLPQGPQANGRANSLEEMMNKLRFELNARINILERKISSSNCSINEKSNSALYEENTRLREIIAQLSCKNSNLEDDNRKLKEEKKQLMQSFEILFQGKSSKDKNANEGANTNELDILADSTTVPREKPSTRKNKKRKNPNNGNTTAANNGNTTTANNGNTTAANNDNTATTAPDPPPNNEAPKGETYIVGDSMVKNLQGNKMSRRRKVKIWTFPGSTTSDMKEYVKPLLKRKPEEIILHVGTNSLRDLDVKACADEIIELARSVGSSVKVSISSIIQRSDNQQLNKKASKVNAAVKSLCTNNGFTFIEHTNINSDHLNRSGLHLNKEGTKNFAVNFINYFRNK